MNLAPVAFQQFFSNNGKPLVGGQLFTYAAGTNNKLATYTNAGGTLNTNPIDLNFRGECSLWLDPALSYKLVLAPRDDTDPPTNPIWSQDDVQAPVTFFSIYPRNQAEIDNGIFPTSYAYPWGNVLRYGAVGDGSADDTVPVQNAAIGGDGLFTAGPGTYRITAEVTFDHVFMQLNGEVLFTSTGPFRGVLQNAVIPHSAFQIPYNLVVAGERLPVVVTGDYYVDPLLGNDANNGTSPTTALRTLQEAADKVAIDAPTATSLAIILRSGRHETAGVQLDATHTLSSGGDVTWVANDGEIPIISAPTLWFFRSSPVSARFGTFASVTNPHGFAFYDLYDAETGEQIDCANNMGPNYSLPRNQAIAVTYSGAGPTETIDLTAEDAANFTALSTTEKAGVRFRISQAFTSSWQNNPSIAGVSLTGDATSSASFSAAIYNNGWNNRTVDAYGAPYLLQNDKHRLNGENFCGYSNAVFLPSRGTNYFTVDTSLTFLINTGASEHHIFRGLKFRYLAVDTATIVERFWTADPFGTFGLLVGGTGTIAAYNCAFEFTNVNGAVMSQNAANFVNCSTYMTGFDGISWNNQYGSDDCYVAFNTVRRWGHYTSMAGRGIYGGGVNILFERNDVRNGSWAAMRADSTANITSPSGAVSGTLRFNVLMNIGMIDGVPADYIANNDSGVLSLYGGQQTCAYNLVSNVVGPAFAYQNMRGIFGDDGIQGVAVTDCLVWGQPQFALDFRTVGANTTFNNSVQNSLFFGALNFQSDTNTSDLSNCLIAATIGNNISAAPAIAVLSPNFYGVKASTNGSYPAVLGTDQAMTAVTSPGTILAPFVKSFLRTMSFIDSGPTYQSPAYVTVTGATYTVLDEDHDITCNLAGTVTLTLPTAFICKNREIYVRTITANTVVSAASDVIPLVGGSAGTAILAATAGKWARLVSDGATWTIVAAN